jgi:hypothetical protein
MQVVANLIIRKLQRLNINSNNILDNNSNMHNNSSIHNNNNTSSSNTIKPNSSNTLVLTMDKDPSTED